MRAVVARAVSERRHLGAAMCADESGIVFCKAFARCYHTRFIKISRMHACVPRQKGGAANGIRKKFRVKSKKSVYFFSAFNYNT